MFFKGFRATYIRLTSYIRSKLSLIHLDSEHLLLSLDYSFEKIKDGKAGSWIKLLIRHISRTCHPLDHHDETLLE